MKWLIWIYIVLNIMDAWITTSIFNYIQGPDGGELAPYCFNPYHAELNPIARFCLEHGGVLGMWIYKLIMIGIAVLAVMYIDKNNHTRHPFYQKYVKPHYIMVAAIVASLIVVLMGLYYFI